MKRTTVQRTSDRELVVTRTFDAPARLVFEAWSRPELFERWWVPKSMGMTLRSCEMDVRTGGTYRLDFGDGMDFFGTYLEVTPHSRSTICWRSCTRRKPRGVRFAPATAPLQSAVIVTRVASTTSSRDRSRHARAGRIL
jgi:uncharacterized protein YndB with AHSA1/START domain